MANEQSGEISFKPGDFQPVGNEVAIGPSAFQPLDDKSEAPVSKPAPPELQTNLSLPSNGSIGAYRPSVWERIKNIFTEGIPQLSSRTVYNPKFGSMQLLSPEEAMTPAEQERHPVVTATSEFAGGLTSPQSVALIAGTGALGEIGGAASKIIPRLVSGGFAAQQIYDAAKKSPEIYKAIQAGNYNRAEYLLTHAGLELGMAALGARHALGGKGAITGKTSEVPVETHAIDPQSPVGTLIQGQSAPDVRMVETEAQRTELERREQARTTWTDIEPQRVNPQELQDVSQQLGRPVSEAELPDIRRRMEAERNVEEGLRGNRRDVAGEIREAHRATLEGQNGNRVVTDEHVPVVTKSEVLAERIQRIVDNSEELQKIGIARERIKTVDDIQAQLEKAADHLKQNLDPRVTDTLTFDMQKKLASELGMSAEDLLSRKSGTSFSAEEVTAARSLLKASQGRVLDLARKAASGEVEPRAMTDALAQHKGILDVVRGQVAREAGRALGAWRIAAEDLPSARIADLLSKLSPDQQQHAAELIAKTDPSNPAALNKLVSELTPSSNWDKLFEAWQNSLLSSPKTGIIKAASDVTMLFLNSISKTVAGALGGDRSAIEGWSFAKGAANALGRAGRILLGGEDNGPGFEGSRERVGAIKG